MSSGRQRQRVRIIGAVLVVALLVASAGCTSVNETGGNETSLNSNESTVGQTDASTDSQGQELDEQLAATHKAEVTAAETLTTTVRAHLQTGIGNLSFTSTTQIDLGANEARQESITEASTGNGLIETTLADVESYATEEAVYERTASDFSDEANYTQDSIDPTVWEEEKLTEYLQTDIIGSAEDSILWTRDGTETVDGTEVVRYVADGSGQFDGFQENVTSALDEESNNSSESGLSFTLDNQEITIDSMTATLLVDTDGVVRQLRYTLGGTSSDDPVSLTLELSVSDIDSTTVTEPDWLEEVSRNTS